MSKNVITKITEEYTEPLDEYDDAEFIGYYITIANVDNPFDYCSKYIPRKAFSKDEFYVGREIKDINKISKQGEK